MSNLLKKLFNISRKKQKNNNIEKQSNSCINSSFKVTTESYNAKRANINRKSTYYDDEVFYIRQNIIKYRRNKKISQKELSQCLGFKSTSFIYKLEGGLLHKLSHEQVEDIASCLNVNVDDLLIGYKRI